MFPSCTELVRAVMAGCPGWGAYCPGPAARSRRVSYRAGTAVCRHGLGLGCLGLGVPICKRGDGGLGLVQPSWRLWGRCPRTPQGQGLGLPQGQAELQTPQAGSLQFVKPPPLLTWILRAPGRWKGLILGARNPRLCLGCPSQPLPPSPWGLSSLVPPHLPLPNGSVAPTQKHLLCVHRS